MMDVITKFCAMSGQTVNLKKSRIFTSESIPLHNSQAIRRICGISLTKYLGRYLGVPIIHKLVSEDTDQFIIDKVNQHLNGWKAKCLSFAGRTTLIQSVTSAIPNYVMQTTRLSQSTGDTLDKIIRSCLWGST